MQGLLAGGQKVNSVGVMLDSATVDTLAGGRAFRLGGSADATLVKGVSGKVVGGKDGISAMMALRTKGAYLGGSVDFIWFSLDKKRNAAMYGEDFNARETLNSFDHRSTESQSLANRQSVERHFLPR